MMLALALGFLGAVLVVGAFCGGVFLGCWLCGEEGTPARICSSRDRRLARRRQRDRRRERARRRERRRVYRTGYAGGYGTALDSGDGGTDWRSCRTEERDVRNVETEGNGERQEAEPSACQEAEQSAYREAEEAASNRREAERLKEEQAAFRALQRYSAEHAYGLGETPGCSGTFGLDSANPY